MKKYSQKLMSACLAALLLVSALTACSEGTAENSPAAENTPAADTVTAETPAEETVPEETEPEYVLGLPENLDNQGAAVTVLGWQHHEDVEFDYE